jgi:hypothetical protein
MADLSSELLYKAQIKESRKRKFKAKAFHICNDLVPANLLLKHLNLNQVKFIGLQEIPLEQVVGSQGRSGDFDLKFNSREQTTKKRWQRVAEGRIEGKSLPKPILYKIGKGYYVVDGNHRISVAHSLGETSILAHVQEIHSDYLKEDNSCTRTGFQIREDQGDTSLRS